MTLELGNVAEGEPEFLDFIVIALLVSLSCYS